MNRKLTIIAELFASRRQKEMKMGLIVLIIIIILLVGAFPTWPHSQSWGYGPSSIWGRS